MATSRAFGHCLPTFRKKERRNRRPAPQQRAHRPSIFLVARFLKGGEVELQSQPPFPSPTLSAPCSRGRRCRGRHRHHRRFSSGDEGLLLGPSPPVCPVAVSFDAKTIRKASLVAPGLCRFEVWEEAWEI